MAEDKALRPNKLADIIGQKELIDRLSITLQAAKSRNQSPGHFLFVGPSGTGKTTFALAVANELGVPVRIANGATITKPMEVANLFHKLAPNSVIFVDEIHRMKIEAAELLYTGLEDGRFHLNTGGRGRAQMVEIPLPPFVMIGATTHVGLCEEPLRNRFPNKEFIRYYTDEEIAQLVAINAKKLKVTIDDAATLEVARRSRSTPRTANSRLMWIRDFATVRGSGHISMAIVNESLAMKSIDRLGLELTDQMYLTTLYLLFNGGPAGIAAIATSMGIAQENLEFDVEAFVVKVGLVIRTARGRMLTELGRAHAEYLLGERA
jgi:Holliday junction DNA helicase RuvB